MLTKELLKSRIKSSEDDLATWENILAEDNEGLVDRNGADLFMRRAKLDIEICNLALASLEGEPVWCVIQFGSIDEVCFSEDDAKRALGPPEENEIGATVAQYRLVRMES